MAENEIRIKDLPLAQQINETDDVIVLDNSTDGTRKLQGKVLLDMIHSAMAKGTASGAVASFTDGADNIPMTDLDVAITPKQDLHGYNNPWLGGTGKNKLPMSVSAIKSYNTSGTWSGNTYTLNGVTFTILTDSDNNVTGIKVNGTTTTESAIGFDVCRTTSVVADSYIINGCPEGGGGGTTSYYIKATSGSTNVYDTGEGKDITISSSNLVVTIFVGSANNKTFYPMLRLSTVSDATFAPYENICPISGWTACNVTRSGKNIAYSQTNNTVVAHAKKGVTYTLSFDGTNRGANIRKNTSTGDTVATGANPLTFTADEDFDIYLNAWDSAFTNLQVELGSSATAYETYSGNTYTINFVDGSSPLIVYGGTLDVLSGLLTVDRWYISFAWGDTSSSATLTNVERRTYAFPSTTYNVYPPSADKPQICDKAPYVANYSSDTLHFYCNERQIVMFMPIGTSTSEQITVSGELQTKVTYQLSATQIKTLLGLNQICADTGNIIEADYVRESDIIINQILEEMPTVKFVTQQQYDALPDSKLTDGVIYFIS